MMHTVKQLAKIAGVSARTLHYYDEIGLLPASEVGENGYRYYGEEAVLRLQQILFYRELDFSLAEIQTILDEPEFNMQDALQNHKQRLQQRLGRLSLLIQTIDRTLLHLKGTIEVEPNALFEGFDEAKQAQYEQQITQQYGDKQVKESRQRWASYSPEQKAELKAEGEAIYRDLVELIEQEPARPAVQQVISRWHQHVRAYYEPTPEILEGLGQMYAENSEFSLVFQQLHAQLPDFLHQAIQHYCQNLPMPAQVPGDAKRGSQPTQSAVKTVKSEKLGNPVKI